MKNIYYNIYIYIITYYNYSILVHFAATCGQNPVRCLVRLDNLVASSGWVQSPKWEQRPQDICTCGRVTMKSALCGWRRQRLKLLECLDFTLLSMEQNQVHAHGASVDCRHDRFTKVTPWHLYLVFANAMTERTAKAGCKQHANARWCRSELQETGSDKAVFTGFHMRTSVSIENNA